MTDPSEFLLARIAEDEEAAGRARVYGWPAVLGPDALASHVARWDPARVLAECGARRRIVGYAVAARSVADRAKEMGWPRDIHQAAAVAYEDALRLLALPYASHPDYDEAWRP